MSKQLILHIGLHKTGSSAIKSFLGLNYRTFLSKGIYLPFKKEANFGKRDIHHYIIQSFKSESSKEFCDLLSEIVKRSKNNNKIIISSEMMSVTWVDKIKLRDFIIPPVIYTTD